MSTNADKNEDVPIASKDATNVYIRLIFVRIGEIDTLNEKYQAQASIEARWRVDIDTLSSSLSKDDQKRLSDGKLVTLPNYAQSNWHPQLFIENGHGELKEQIKYTAKKEKQDHQVYVCERRDLKGSFWEKLELYHFPSDVQDLSISIGSNLYTEKVLLVPDAQHLSGVNREAFVDQQEWALYEHVNTEQRFIKEFVFEDEDEDDEKDEDGHVCAVSTNDSVADRRHSVLTVTCHAARRSNYYYWNGYCLILLITLASFCIFSIPPHFTGNRIQISCTLLLTSITFRWTVNRSLPTISYLTSMDKYAIMCIFVLVFNCFWHAIIGFIIYINNESAVKANTWLARLDQLAFCIAFGGYLLIHVWLFGWLFAVPLRHRKMMAEKDAQYNLAMLEKKNKKKKTEDKKPVKRNSAYTAVPVVS